MHEIAFSLFTIRNFLPSFKVLSSNLKLRGHKKRNTYIILNKVYIQRPKKHPQKIVTLFTTAKLCFYSCTGGDDYCMSLQENLQHLNLMVINIFH